MAKWMLHAFLCPKSFSLLSLLRWLDRLDYSSRNYGMLDRSSRDYKSGIWFVHCSDRLSVSICSCMYCFQPMPKHSFLFGHFLYLWRARRGVPADLDKMQFFRSIMERDFERTGSFYLDLWPIRNPILITKSQTRANQATVTNAAIAVQRPLDLKY